MASAVPLAIEHDPVLAAALAAPVDDEPETEEERAAVEEGMAAIRAGHWVSHEDVRATIDRRRRVEG
jgi:predicted transcriptional regulator